MPVAVAYQEYVLALIRPDAAGGKVGHVSPTPKQQSGRRTTMYAQLTYFDGPRTPEQTAADDFGARERIIPAGKDRPVRFELPQIRSIADVVAASDPLAGCGCSRRPHAVRGN